MDVVAQRVMLKSAWPHYKCLTIWAYKDNPKGIKTWGQLSDSKLSSLDFVLDGNTLQNKLIVDFVVSLCD